MLISANSAKKDARFQKWGCHFCEFCEKDARFQKGDVISAISAKKTHVSQGYNLFLAKNVNFCEFCEKGARFQKGGVIFCEICEKYARFPRV